MQAFPAFLVAVRQTAWQAPASLFVSGGAFMPDDMARGFSTKDQRVLMHTDISDVTSVNNTMSVLEHWKAGCKGSVIQQSLGQEWFKYKSSSLPRFRPNK